MCPARSTRNPASYWKKSSARNGFRRGSQIAIVAIAACQGRARYAAAPGGYWQASRNEPGAALNDSTSNGPPAPANPSLLRWIYVSRVTVAAGILVGALLVWGSAQPGQTFLATVAFLGALLLSGWSYSHTHLRRHDPGTLFLLAQSVFDAGLATVVIHITGGAESALTPLYILVISIAALLLRPSGVFTVWLSASGFFILDQTVWLQAPLTLGVAVLVVLFALVAVVTGWLGQRLRLAGTTLGEVKSELEQLRLDTGDILATLSTGLISVDSQGRLLYMNLAAEALLGFDSEEYLGMPVLGAVDAVSPSLAVAVRQSLVSRRALAREKVTARLGGEDRVLGLSTAVLERAGAATTVTVIFQDITDADRIDALNRRTERLEAVAELSASLAHEIKNPLASIRSSVEQLGSDRLDEADRSTLSSLILTESDRLSRLLSDFIEFARIRSGAVEPVNVADIVETAVALAREHPDAVDDTELDVTIDPTGGPTWTSGDADLLHRAVFNLVLNAVQFAGPKGTVAVTVNVRSGDRGGLEPKLVQILVEDSGPGIDPDERSRIFDPFYTTRVDGSGLGLSVVHRAVEAHAGTVFIESSILGGAAFVIQLPATAAPARKTHTDTRPAIDRRLATQGVT